MSVNDRERLDEIMDNNACFLEIVADYVNQTSLLIDREQVLSVCARTGVSEERAFSSALALEYGFDPDNDRFDAAFVRDYFVPSVRKLDVADFACDPYYQKINLPLSARSPSGRWSVARRAFQPYEGFVRDDILCPGDFVEIPRVGFFPERFEYPSLLEDGREWMTVTPLEINTMREPIGQASGRVISFGLGLGYFSYLAHLKPSVSRVVAVERDPDLIAFFSEFILPLFDFPDKISLVCADAFDYASSDLPRQPFDFAFVDLWHNVGDGLPSYCRMKCLQHLSPSVRFSYWIESSLLSALRSMSYRAIADDPSIPLHGILPAIGDDALRTLAADLGKRADNI